MCVCVCVCACVLVHLVPNPCLSACTYLSILSKTVLLLLTLHYRVPCNLDLGPWKRTIPYMQVLMYISGRERVYIRKRAGFIKYALQHGYRLCVGYTFGESDLYSSIQFSEKLRMWIVKTFGFVLPIFWGKYGPLCPVLPNDDVRTLRCIRSRIFGGPVNDSIVP